MGAVKSVPGATVTLPRIAPQSSGRSSPIGTIAATGRLCFVSTTALVLPVEECAIVLLDPKHPDHLAALAFPPERLPEGMVLTGRSRAGCLLPE